MNKTWLIAKREFLTTVRRISYILLTISFPVLALLGILIYMGVTHWAVSPPPEEQKIGYVDETGIFDDYTSADGVIFIPYDTNDTAKSALLSKEVSEYFIIPEDYLETGLIKRDTTQRELELPEVTMARIKKFLVANLLAAEEVSEEVLIRAQTPVLPVSYRLDPETGEIIPPESGFAVFGMPIIFALLFMVSLFVTSGFLLQGVSEEKENRLMEILLSSVSARQLMSGKVMGLGAAGLLQIVIWLLSAMVLTAIASTTILPLAGLTIPTRLIIFGIIYFILGYLLFAILMAGLGSLGSTAKESSQWTTIVILPALIPVWLYSLFIINPDHIVFTILTLFPLTAPTMAVMRLSIASLPIWQLLLSIAILIASILGAIWLAARVFRTFLLMYGKRPSFAEIWRYIREG